MLTATETVLETEDSVAAGNGSETAEETVGAAQEPHPTFEETVAALRARAEASEGNYRQALALLTVAEQLDRQIGQYQRQRDGIKAASTGGNRIGVRLSHLQHSITRTTKSRDRYLSETETALAATAVPT